MGYLFNQFMHWNNLHSIEQLFPAVPEGVQGGLVGMADTNGLALLFGKCYQFI